MNTGFRAMYTVVRKSTLVLIAFLMVLSGAISAFAADGTYKMSWGTDGVNGSGGSVTSSPAITNGTARNYTGSNSIVFTLSPSTNYYVSKVEARRTKSDGSWNNWYTLPDSNVSMAAVDSGLTQVTLSTAQYSGSYRNYEFKVTFALNSSSSSAGTFNVNWGTDGVNGTGGDVTSTSYTISRNSNISYSGTQSIVMNISPTSGYYVSSVQARRTKSDGSWNNWYTLNDSNITAVVIDGTSTTITLNTAQINGSYRDFEIKVTFGTNNILVSWGANNSANDGLGGSITSSGKTIINGQNVTPGFSGSATASFSINPDPSCYATKVEYKRDDWSNWANVPGWSSGSSTFSFSINSHNWSVRVTFYTPTNQISQITAYYGTTNTAGFNTAAADWVGGNVYRSSTQLGTNANLTYTYSSSNTMRTIRITPSSGYKIVKVQWAEATWSMPSDVTPGTFTDEPVVQEYNNSGNNITLPTTQDSQITIPVAYPKCYLVWVVFAPVGATGGTVGAWYGTNNVTAYDTPVANGSGGTVYKTSGTTQMLANRDPAGSVIATDSTVTFQARPNAGFKVSSIRYGQDSPTTSVTVPAGQTTPLSFSFSVAGGNVYKIWVTFTSTAATSFSVSGTIDAGSNAACTGNSISPASDVVNGGATGSFSLSTSSNCMIDCINFNGAGCTPTGSGSLSGNVYTTPAITATSAFTVKFKPVGYNIVAEIDSLSPSGCGSISYPGTQNFPKGSNVTYSITTNTGCAISHVWVTDTNIGYTSDTDIAPLAGSTYTFQDLQAAGHIKVQFTSVVPTSSDSYCQIPPFVAGQIGLAPNVLIVFDNSGSMGGTMGDAYYNKKTYDCTASSTLANCTNFYGYFDPGKMYKVDPSDANKYLVDAVSLNLSTTSGKSGNYLNYRYMDKVDIIRKALMGGKVVDRTAATKFLSSNAGKKVEYGTTLPSGIVQRLSGKVRFGMMVFNDPPEGGRLATVPGTTRKTVLGSSEADLIAAMESTETDPKTNTPIAETLYEAIRYYQAKPSAYNTGVDYSTMDPIQNNCQKHFILLVTDGEPNSNNNLPGLGTQPTKNGYTDVNFNVNTWENRIPVADRAIDNSSSCFTNTYHCPAGSTNNCATNSEKVEGVSYYMHTTDLRSDREGTQNITLFPVYAFGDGTGTKTLHMAAKYGGFENKNGNAPSPNSYTSPDEQDEWDKDGNCVPDNYFEADDGAVLESNIMSAMTNILAKVASGTAASILSNSEGSGANLLQAVFYPNKIFEGSTEANWIGEMQNMWYYVDPFISNSTVREDTDSNRVLDLKSDYATRFFFNGTETLVKVERDSNGDGLGDTLVNATTKPDDIKSIWRAGRQLRSRSADSRTIHTSIDGLSLLSASSTGGGFYPDTARATSLQPYLQAANNDSYAEAKKIISFIRGDDQIGYRSRTVKLTSTDTGLVWKLGDIISSTPKIQSTIRLNSYNFPAPSGYNDASYASYIGSAEYKKRGMVYVGANDGMLHAFKLGTLTVSGSSISGSTKAILTGNNLGEEQWAYIPRNALPYLKYSTDLSNYKHLYYVDGPTVLSDVAVGSCGTGDYSMCAKSASTWRTVLIGSMGLGGASRLKDTTACTDGATGTCVKTPIFDPTDTGSTKTKGVGYSSYYALDVTNQYYDASGNGNVVNQPTLKWEFSHPELGYSTSGAAIVRISAKTTGTTPVTDNTKNGKWYAVIASGPTGPIDTYNHQFKGKSDQNLKLFIIDLGATSLVEGQTYWIKDTGIKRAFGGSMLPAAIDTDRWDSASQGHYQHDALYVGYSKANISDSVALTAATEWTDGGVLRILTKEDPDPTHWVVSPVITGIGPVTAGIAKLQDRNNKKLWLYFGTGRFYFTNDDPDNQRYLMGVQDGCYTSSNKLDPNCNTSVAGAPLTLTNLKNQSSYDDMVATDKGWYIPLAGRVDTLGAERVITDAVAQANGTVCYTTFLPTSDVCKFGGDSYMWCVKYNSGGCVCPSGLVGKVLVQVSTGSFEEIDMSKAFNYPACSACSSADGGGGQPNVCLNPPCDPITNPPPPTADGRKMGSPMTGKPPLDAPPIVSNSALKPVKKILHLQEK